MKKPPFVFVRDVELVGGRVIKKGTIAKLTRPRNAWAVGVTEHGWNFMVEARDLARRAA